jgi:hypothetical protein
MNKAVERSGSPVGIMRVEVQACPLVFAGVDVGAGAPTFLSLVLAAVKWLLSKHFLSY